jgi:DNA-binding MurR/RpiR family transcriptional regulator
MRNYPKASNLRTVAAIVIDDRIFNRFMKKVIKAARKGNFGVSFSGHVSSDFVSRFRSLGYVVNYTTQKVPNENREKATTQISW